MPIPSFLYNLINKRALAALSFVVYGAARIGAFGSTEMNIHTPTLGKKNNLGEVTISETPFCTFVKWYEHLEMKDEKSYAVETRKTKIFLRPIHIVDNKTFIGTFGFKQL